MTAEEHQQFAKRVEGQVRRVFPELDCRIRPFVDTATGKPMAQFICECHVTTPPVRVVYSILGNEIYNLAEIEVLTYQVGTTLLNQVQAVLLQRLN